MTPEGFGENRGPPYFLRDLSPQISGNSRYEVGNTLHPQGNLNSIMDDIRFRQTDCCRPKPPNDQRVWRGGVWTSRPWPNTDVLTQGMPLFLTTPQRQPGGLEIRKVHHPRCFSFPERSRRPASQSVGVRCFKPTTPFQCPQLLTADRPGVAVQE